MRIYLDIDGTLIHEDVRNYGKPALGLEELLVALKNHQTYWLTTHCRDGNPDKARSILKSAVSLTHHDQIDRIIPTIWDTQKIEAIDWTQEFIWLDNDINQLEQVQFHRTLPGQNVIEVDLKSNSEQILEIAADLDKLNN